MGMIEDIADLRQIVKKQAERIAALEETGAKPWYLSKGIMGPAWSLALKLVALLCWYKGIDPEIVLSVLGASGIGDIVGAVGRATAKQRIK